MPFTYRRRARVTPRTTTTTTTRRRGLFPRRRAHATHTTHAPVAAHHHHHHHYHQKRKPTIKDKLSGALLKMKGTLTHRPAVKAAGTRRMHGTDGRGSHRPRRRLF